MAPPRDSFHPPARVEVEHALALPVLAAFSLRWLKEWVWSLDLPALDSLESGEVRWALAAGAVSALVTALVTYRVLRRARVKRSKHLLDLAHAANAVSAHRDYSIRAVNRSDDEVGLLVDTFNRMLSQIEINDERMRSAVQQAEAAKVAKAKFLATMSHEIRTPINGILGMTQLLSDTDLSSEQEEFTKMVHQSAENLLAIINDILDFSKGEAAKYELEEIPFSISELIGDCLDTVSTVARKKELELCGHVETGVPEYVRGDPVRLRQVILNLLSNAVKFTREGEVALRVVVSADHGESAELRFEVRDTGIGVPKDRVERLFNSFTQVDASNNRRYGGTGLGLAISKQILTAMNGTMFVKTTEGKGSIFGFRLELSKEEVSEDELVQGPSGLRILVIEENQAMRESLAAMLEGNDVKACPTGIAGRRTLLKDDGEKYDLIMLDVRQSEEFGLGLGEDLSFPDIPLVLLAPVDRLGSEAVMEWVGRTACLAKPLKKRELLWCLSEVLSNEPRMPKPARKRVEPEEEHLGDIRVLVAEDHPVNQRITTSYLDKIGVKWELVENGEDAIIAVENTRFDVVLMDVQMPIMDGIEATRKIRELESKTGKRVPIVAMTAAVLEEDRRECEDAGFDDYVPKPVKLSELGDRVKLWARKQQRLAA
jgi:signal transduction histidine kinase/CheY-like chemotaxis protein